MNNRFHGDIDNEDKWGPYISVEESVKFWVHKNKCMKTNIDTLPDLNEQDGSFIIRERYEECNNDNEVWFYRVVKEVMNGQQSIGDGSIGEIEMYVLVKKFGSFLAGFSAKNISNRKSLSERKSKWSLKLTKDVVALSEMTINKLKN